MHELLSVKRTSECLAVDQKINLKPRKPLATKESLEDEEEQQERKQLQDEYLAACPQTCMACHSLKKCQ